MNQTALNLTAISVFLMTLSVLLGPLVNLSPIVPAIATFSLLSLATLDAFSLQGRGGNLILDTLARLSPTYRARVIRHEAGHLLVAHQLGIPVTDYALNAWEALRKGFPGTGGIQFNSQEVATQVQTGHLSAALLDRYCVVWMAGIVAEQLVYGTAEGGADDRQQIQSILTQLRLPSSDIEQKQRWAMLRAKTLLQEHWTAYETVVQALEERRSITEIQERLQA